MDKLGKLALMYNNGFGELPDCLLGAENNELLLDDLIGFLYDESVEYAKFNVHGSFLVDLYSSSYYRAGESRLDVQSELQIYFDRFKRTSEVCLPANKGIYVYEALNHGDSPSERPVVYDGQVGNGDYYRHLIPTIFSTIDDIPVALRKIVAVSNTLSFSDAPLIDGDAVKIHFWKLFG
jgi:hypothetical protein